MEDYKKNKYVICEECGQRLYKKFTAISTNEQGVPIVLCFDCFEDMCVREQGEKQEAGSAKQLPLQP